MDTCKFGTSCHNYLPPFLVDIVMYFYLDCHCNKQNSAAWLCVQQKCLEQSVSFWFILFIYSRTCLIWHTKGPGKCVGLYRMLEPVYSDTPRDQGNVLGCTGCQNLSNPTHQGTREMCQIVQDVRTCLIQHTKGSRKCVRLYRMSEPV
jgi:hypothetical protein